MSAVSLHVHVSLCCFFSRCLLFLPQLYILMLWCGMVHLRGARADSCPQGHFDAQKSKALNDWRSELQARKVELIHGGKSVCKLRQRIAVEAMQAGNMNYRVYDCNADCGSEGCYSGVNLTRPPLYTSTSLTHPVKYTRLWQWATQSISIRLSIEGQKWVFFKCLWPVQRFPINHGRLVFPLTTQLIRRESRWKYGFFELK